MKSIPGKSTRISGVPMVLPVKRGDAYVKIIGTVKEQGSGRRLKNVTISVSGAKATDSDGKGNFNYKRFAQHIGPPCHGVFMEGIEKKGQSYIIVMVKKWVSPYFLFYWWLTAFSHNIPGCPWYSSILIAFKGVPKGSFSFLFIGSIAWNKRKVYNLRALSVNILSVRIGFFFFNPPFPPPGRPASAVP